MEFVFVETEKEEKLIFKMFEEKKSFLTAHLSLLKTNVPQQRIVVLSTLAPPLQSSILKTFFSCLKIRAGNEVCLCSQFGFCCFETFLFYYLKLLL
jgi:hypothetical protein